ncbi:MAG: hypothetical protein M1286_01865 [Candidatus Marsarchaeota archaeon]|nr:hypothetical protein [Candidatus Marsarchaeota archaeon]
MGTGEESKHALNLVISQLAKAKDGRKLKVGMDIDDTAASTSLSVRSLMEERFGFDFSSVGRKYDWSSTGATDRHFMEIYNELWQRDGREIAPAFSKETFTLLNEKTDFSFVSARGEESSEGLYRWVSNHYGVKARAIVVDPRPYDMHGIRKLEAGFDLLIDDSPHVAVNMKAEIAKDRALLLVDKWEEAVERRHTTNTAVVDNTEHAARVILEAHRVREQPAHE